jgi:hypothetical protein
VNGDYGLPMYILMACSVVCAMCIVRVQCSAECTLCNNAGAVCVDCMYVGAVRCVRGGYWCVGAVRSVCMCVCTVQCSVCVSGLIGAVPDVCVSVHLAHLSSGNPYITSVVYAL